MNKEFENLIRLRIYKKLETKRRSDMCKSLTINYINYYVIYNIRKVVK